MIRGLSVHREGYSYYGPLTGYGVAGLASRGEPPLDETALVLLLVAQGEIQTDCLRSSGHERQVDEVVSGSFHDERKGLVAGYIPGQVDRLYC